MHGKLIEWETFVDPVGSQGADFKNNFCSEVMRTSLLPWWRLERRRLTVCLQPSTQNTDFSQMFDFSHILFHIIHYILFSNWNKELLTISDPCTPLPRRLGAYSAKSTSRNHSVTRLFVHSSTSAPLNHDCLIQPKYHWERRLKTTTTTTTTKRSYSADAERITTLCSVVWGDLAVLGGGGRNLHKMSRRS